MTFDVYVKAIILKYKSAGSHPRPSWSSGRTCPDTEPGEAPPAWTHPPDRLPALPGTPSASGSRSQTAGTDSAEDSITASQWTETPELQCHLISVRNHIRLKIGVKAKEIWRRLKLELLLARYLVWWGQHGCTFALLFVTKAVCNCTTYTSDWLW